MINVSLEDSNLIITRPVEHTELDIRRALTLRQVRDTYELKGRGNRKLNLETLRRWANSKRGYRPAGKNGPVLVLPTLLRGGEHLTLPEWVEWFLREADHIRDSARRSPLVVSRKTEQREAEAARKRLRKSGLEC